MCKQFWLWSFETLDTLLVAITASSGVDRLYTVI